MNLYKQILKEIKKNDNILITSHIRADGDCVGSAVGLKEIIKTTYPEKTVKATFEKVHYLKHLGNPDEVLDEDFENFLIISVDNASKSRANDKRLENAKRIIKIDHHPNNEPFGYVNLVEEDKASCSEMIFELFLNMKKGLISKLGIEAIYTGIITDTGRFKYPSVSGDTMKKVALMYDLGLDATRILNILDETTLEELKFKGYVLSNMTKTENGVLYIKITPELRKEYNIEYDDASNMVNSMSDVEGCPIWVLFNEYKKDEIRCRVRSKDIPINKIAESFGGGGHKNASGIVVKSYEIVDEIIKTLDQEIKNYKNN